MGLRARKKLLGTYRELADMNRNTAAVILSQETVDDDSLRKALELRLQASRLEKTIQRIEARSTVK